MPTSTLRLLTAMIRSTAPQRTTHTVPKVNSKALEKPPKTWRAISEDARWGLSVAREFELRQIDSIHTPGSDRLFEFEVNGSLESLDLLRKHIEVGDHDDAADVLAEAAHQLEKAEKLRADKFTDKTAEWFPPVDANFQDAKRMYDVAERYLSIPSFKPS
ncbi:MAG: hypothetical protein DHS20C10_06180 [marine bacterium B5-7]|nr:MAG: hypothetical protein DHS20C10_06180 [marine bacterium B5-7]